MKRNDQLGEDSEGHRLPLLYLYTLDRSIKVVHYKAVVCIIPLDGIIGLCV